MQVRPSYAEASLRQVPWGVSLRDHLLANYKQSLIAIVLNLFDRSKRFKDGMQARARRIALLAALSGASSLASMLVHRHCACERCVERPPLPIGYLSATTTVHGLVHGVARSAKPT